ncbi:hypothetical protein PR003_g22499 [Phytophthora rubi]|uniref:Uncharacterized protein n=1 Tax=Phytophthora rubi TaxID=129364 RepID=A0A6A4D512_9STRA|nr:hypothetical protein PR001_g31528 [Phytophthora rubi]KAE8993407.1 hypothetical protein PR002_g20248 [Phytophthora rubi]KAE8993410.1 hypothetical protein PR002_g20250 [Phytophthora rubi]KAE9301518.1 hypothetical protein PR003_g22499 [Phytophthora rubi]
MTALVAVAELIAAPAVGLGWSSDSRPLTPAFNWGPAVVATPTVAAFPTAIPPSSVT